MDRPEEINECFTDLGPEALEVELYVNELEHQRDQLREALDDLMYEYDKNDGHLETKYLSSVRPKIAKARAALKATEEG